MDFLRQVIRDCGLSGFPVGLGGCRASDTHFDACSFDLVVFDGRRDGGVGASRTVKSGGDLFTIHHASLSETDPRRLLQYDGLRIIQDDSWELRTMLAGISKRRSRLFSDLAKDSLIESMFCCQRARDAIRGADVFAPCWQKCASFYLADAISAINHIRPSPSHMISALRHLEGGPASEHVDVAIQTIGIERATPTLLERMARSTIGFIGVAGGDDGDATKTVRQKHDFFVANSMFANDYFYLGYTCRDVFVGIKDRLGRELDLFHILQVAFDTDADSNALLRRSDLVAESSRAVLEGISGA